MRLCIRRFLSIFTLVSRVPIRGSFEPDYSRADFFLPLIGPLASLAALLGFALGTLALRNALLAALLSLCFQYLAFNLFHLDGLLDSADAMLCFATKERRLEILKDSRIGVYAFFVGFVALALRLGALASLAVPGKIAGAAIAALLAAPAAGRAASALVPMICAPARPSGLGALIRDQSPARLVFGLLLALLPLAAWSFASGDSFWGITAALAAVAAALVSGATLARLYKHRVGGFTGDALGAAVEVGELIVILTIAAVAAWR